jgi:hypothetical protein
VPVTGPVGPIMELSMEQGDPTHRGDSIFRGTLSELLDTRVLTGCVCVIGALAGSCSGKKGHPIVLEHT